MESLDYHRLLCSYKALSGIYEDLDLIPSTIKSFTSLQNIQVLRDLKSIHFAVCQNKFQLKCDYEHPEAIPVRLDGIRDRSSVSGEETPFPPSAVPPAFRAQQVAESRHL